MTEGTVFNIQRFSVHDGPGIRTTIFFKGCNLKCLWCHNPESKGYLPQLAFAANKCIGCLKCEEVCENGGHSHIENKKQVAYKNCVVCRKCAEICPAGALEIMGKKISAEDAVKEAAKDIPFYSNGGGITLSGGEPAMQPEFALEILKLSKEMGMHTAIETAGHIPWKVYKSFLPYLDMVLFDIKQMDTKKHKEYTGKGNELIHENLINFCKEDIEVIVRLPVIPGYNNENENFIALAKFLKTLEKMPKVEVLPYNPLAGAKHPRIGEKYGLEIDEKNGNSPEDIVKLLADNGITSKVNK